MTPVELIQLLETTGISLAVQGGRLKVDAPAGTLTPELRQTIVVHKTSLMVLMSKRHSHLSQLPLVARSTESSTATLARWDSTLDERIKRARAKRDALSVRFNKGLNHLEMIQAHGESATVEFGRLFVIWEKSTKTIKRQRIGLPNSN